MVRMGHCVSGYPSFSTAVLMAFALQQDLVMKSFMLTRSHWPLIQSETIRVVER
jgi:hypothetical protein